MKGSYLTMIINNACNTECDDSRMGASLKQLIKVFINFFLHTIQDLRKYSKEKKDFDSYLRPSETHKKL